MHKNVRLFTEKFDTKYILLAIFKPVMRKNVRLFTEKFDTKYILLAIMKRQVRNEINTTFLPAQN